MDSLNTSGDFKTHPNFSNTTPKTEMSLSWRKRSVKNSHYIIISLHFLIFMLFTNLISVKADMFIKRQFMEEDLTLITQRTLYEDDVNKTTAILKRDLDLPCDLVKVEELFNLDMDVLQVTWICRNQTYAFVLGLLRIFSYMFAGFLAAIFGPEIYTILSNNTISLVRRMSTRNSRRTSDSSVPSTSSLDLRSRNQILFSEGISEMRSLRRIKRRNKAIEDDLLSHVKARENRLFPTQVELEAQSGLDAQSLMTMQLDSEYVNLICNVIMFYRSVSADTSPTNWIINIFNFIRIYYKDLQDVQRIVSTIAFFGDDVLEAQSLPQGLKSARYFVDNWKAVSDSEVVTKMQKVLHGLISCGMVASMGLKFSDQGYRMLFGKGLPKFDTLSIQGLAFHVTEFVVTFLETGYQCFVDGNLRPILVKNKKVRDWIDLYVKLKDDINALPHDVHADAEKLILRIQLHLSDGITLLNEDKSLSLMWRDLSQRFEKIQKEYGINAVRKPPFAVLINGPPNIGKSTIVSFIGAIYAQATKDLYDLTYDPAKTVYSYQSSDQYMSGYKGAGQWMVLMDDIAREHVKHVTAGQTSYLSDLIMINNSIGFASVQADLQDKGRVPVCPRCLVATTNTKNLNAYFGLSSPGAALRRLPIVISPILKEEYIGEHGGMKKLTEIVTDTHFFKIERVKILPNEHVVYDVYLPETNEFVSLADVGERRILCTNEELAPFLVEQIRLHEENAEVMSAACKMMKDATLCEHNVLSIHVCSKCEQWKQDNTDAIVEAISDNETTLQAHSFSFPRLSAQRKEQYMVVGLSLFENYLPLSWQNNVLGFVFRNYPEYFVGAVRARTLRGIPPGVVKLQFGMGLIAGSLGIMGLMSVLPFLFSKVPTIIPKRKKEVPLEAHGDIWHVATRAQDFFRPPSTSKPNNRDEIIRTITRSMLRINVRSQNGQKGSACATYLGNNKYLTVAHLFHPGDHWHVRADYGEGHAHASSVVGFTLAPSMVDFFHNDIAVFTSSALLPRRPIFKFLPKQSDSVGRNGLRIERLPDGSMEEQEFVSMGVRRLSYGSPIGDRVGNFCDAHLLHRKSVLGDCGSIALSQTGDSFTITGIQCAGSPSHDISKRVIFTQVSQDLFSDIMFENELMAHSSSCDDDFHLNSKTGPLKPPHYKGVHHWIKPDSSTIMLGSFDKRSTHRSHVHKSIICDEVEETFDIINPFTSPLMRPIVQDGIWINPYTIATDLMSKPTPFYTDDILLKASDNYLKRIGDMCENKWLCDSVDVFTAVNGVDGDTLLGGLPMSTSGGFAFPGCKRDYFHVIDDKYYPNEEVQKEIDKIEEAYILGNRAHIVFQGSLKDEPVKVKKRKSGETRVFTACSVPFSIVVRKQFMMLTKCLRVNNFASECAVGMDCYSPIWQTLYHYLTVFGKDRIIAGDYKSYDKQMPASVIRAVFYILIELRSKNNCLSARDKALCIGISTDICFPIVNMNGDLFQFFGSNPSGQPLTVIVNSLANSLYMRIAYFDIVGDFNTFSRHVNLMTLGDDNIMGSSNNSFNHTTIVEVLRRRGIVYTMADKEAASVPFINITDTDFLKRTFRRNEIRVVAPIAKNSVFKSLLMTTSKGNISDEEVLSQAYLSARREFCLHGKADFEDFTKKMDGIFNNHPSIKRFFIPQHSFDYKTTLNWTLGIEDISNSSHEESGVNGSDNLGQITSPSQL